MKHFRKNEGFTLVELMVSILIGTIITGAAVTVLLLGLRMNRSSIDTASRQNTTRILMSVLENLASEGKITSVKTTLQSWEVKERDNVLLSYSADKQAIYTGESDVGTPILEGVVSSYVELNENGLLKFSVETVDGIFNSSVYCRSVVSAAGSSGLPNDDQNKDNKPDKDVFDRVVNTTKQRSDFVNVLLSQYQKINNGFVLVDNPGMIIDSVGNKGMYYTQWYVGGTYSNGWNKDTPWCAAYISWCLNQVKDEVNAPSNRPVPNGDGSRWYANVDDFWGYIKSLNDPNGVYGYKKAKWLGGEYTPQSGDLVFFDWIVNAEENPEHMGVVLSVTDQYIFTIEGNTAGRVALRQYSLRDSRIIGYGVLNWVADTN